MLSIIARDAWRLPRRLAGLDHVNPHMFRHISATRIPVSTNSRIMASSRRSAVEQGAAVADERAREAHRRISPGDRL